MCCAGAQEIGPINHAYARALVTNRSINVRTIASRLLDNRAVYSPLKSYVRIYTSMSKSADERSEGNVGNEAAARAECCPRSNEGRVEGGCRGRPLA